MDIVANLKYCKSCLIIDAKMYHINNSSSLRLAYEQLLQIPFCDTYPQYICYECASLLQKYQEFRSKCITANNILSGLLMDNIKITYETVKSINRKKYNLESKLTRSNIITYNNQYDVQKDCDNEGIFYFDEIKMEFEPGGEDFFARSPPPNIDTPNEITCDSSQSNDHFIANVDEDDDYIPMKKQKRQISTKSLKELKTKKHKNSPIKEEYDDLEDINFCSIDDEPLSRIATKTLKEDSRNNKTKQILKENTRPVKRKCGPKFNASVFEDYATVYILTPEDAKKEVLLRKESNNYINCAFKCDLCYRGYETKATFENHMKKHSKEYGELECEFCHLRSPSNKFLSKHQIACHKRKFSCKICPYTCFSTHQARNHISMHKGKTYPCEECGEIFRVPNSLLMHKRIKHLTECVCGLCGSTFATDRGLYSHKLLLHRQEKNEERGPKCEECGVQFATDVAWKRHLVLSSKHKISNGCEICGETFLEESALKIHMKNKHARKQIHLRNVKLPVSCAICGEWLAKLATYKSHMTSQHPLSEVAKKILSEGTTDKQLQFMCEVCGKGFRKQCFLTYHQRKHTGERPYECAECGKRFAVPTALSTHKAKHSRRRYQCDMCQKVFTFRSALTKHVKAHLGIRPHKCSICDKSFPNPCDVKLHMKYVHYKVPWPKRDRAKREKEPVF